MMEKKKTKWIRKKKQMMWVSAGAKKWFQVTARLLVGVKNAGGECRKSIGKYHN